MTPLVEPPWERSLAQMVALHALAVAGYDLTGNAAAVESARLQVVAVIDRAAAAGVSEASIDAALTRLAAQQEAPTADELDDLEEADDQDGDGSCIDPGAGFQSREPSPNLPQNARSRAATRLHAKPSHSRQEVGEG